MLCLLVHHDVCARKLVRNHLCSHSLLPFLWSVHPFSPAPESFCNFHLLSEKCLDSGLILLSVVDQNKVMIIAGAGGNERRMGRISAGCKFGGDFGALLPQQGSKSGKSEGCGRMEAFQARVVAGVCAPLLGD